MNIDLLKSAIPWWGKIVAKIILSRLPMGYGFWQRIGLFRHGRMDMPEYAVGVLESHVQRAGLRDNLAGKTILELGPGDSVATAVIAAAHGAQAVLVDVGLFANTDLRPYKQLQEALVKRGLFPPDLSRCKSINETLNACHASYLTEGESSLRTLLDESVDLIFSQAMLEHVRKDEFLSVMKECHRIIRPNGVCSHCVDLKDHLGGRLNNLRFSSRIWESDSFARSGFYTNRIRYSQMREFFRQAGFEVEVMDVRRWETLPIHRKKLAPEFRRLPDDELLVSGFDVILKRRDRLVA